LRITAQKLRNFRLEFKGILPIEACRISALIKESRDGQKAA